MAAVGVQPSQRGRTDTSGKGPLEEGEQLPHCATPAPCWTKLIDILTTIGSDLMKEEDVAPRRGIASRLQDTIRQVRAMSAPPPGPDTISDRLAGIENALKQLTKATPKVNTNTPTPRGQTWAAIAADSARSAPAATSNRAAVRVRFEQHENARDTLAKVRTIIPEVYAIRTLQSGDIDVMVPSYAIKDRILNQPDIQGCKVLR